MEFIIRKFDLFKLIFFNKAERDFVNLKHPYKIDKKNNKIVLVEIGLDIYFLVHFYFLLKERKFRNNKFVGLWINPMRMRRPGFTGTIAFLFQCLVQYLIKLKWMKIYKCLGFNSFIDLSNDFKDSIETHFKYSIYTKKFDSITTADRLCDAEEASKLRKQLDKQTEKLDSTITILANKLQRKLLSKQNRWWEFDLEEGILDSGKLARIITTPESSLSYKKEKDTEFKDTVVSLLIDNSGSMRGRPITIAAISTDILAKTLERCGIKVEVLGFTTRTWKGGKARDAWIKENKPKLGFNISK